MSFGGMTAIFAALAVVLPIPNILLLGLLAVIFYLLAGMCKVVNISHRFINPMLAISNTDKVSDARSMGSALLSTQCAGVRHAIYKAVVEQGDSFA